MSHITITKEYLQGLRKAYHKALKDNKPDFTYDGNDFLTLYAKYLLEYYEPMFGILPIHKAN